MSWEHFKQKEEDKYKMYMYLCSSLQIDSQIVFTLLNIRDFSDTSYLVNSTMKTLIKKMVDRGYYWFSHGEFDSYVLYSIRKSNSPIYIKIRDSNWTIKLTVHLTTKKVKYLWDHKTTVECNGKTHSCLNLVNLVLNDVKTFERLNKLQRSFIYCYIRTHKSNYLLFAHRRSNVSHDYIRD